MYGLLIKYNNYAMLYKKQLNELNIKYKRYRTQSNGYEYIGYLFNSREDRTLAKMTVFKNVS